jgi:hypothetical protein
MVAIALPTKAQCPASASRIDMVGPSPRVVPENYFVTNLVGRSRNYSTIGYTSSNSLEVQLSNAATSRISNVSRRLVEQGQ